MEQWRRVLGLGHGRFHWSGGSFDRQPPQCYSIFFISADENRKKTRISSLMKTR